MDSGIPPDLREQYTYLRSVGTYFERRPGYFVHLFSLSELWNLRTQAQERRQECLTQLYQQGQCVLSGLKAGEDGVEISIDRNCLIMKRAGRQTGDVRLAVPGRIAETFPASRSRLPALVCPSLPEEPASSPFPDFSSQLKRTLPLETGYLARRYYRIG